MSNNANSYRYLVYYEFLGPTAEDPLAQHFRSDEDIQFELNGFQDLLSLNLCNEMSKTEFCPSFEKPHSIFLEIKTDLTSDKVKEIILECLRNTPLFAKQIK